MMKGGVVQRVDQWVRQLLPAGAVLVFLLVQAIPWRLPEFAAVVPLLPLVGVYYWAVYRPELLPASVAFGLGLINDIIVGGPLGVSSLVFLMVQGMTASQRRFFHGKSFLVVWCGFGLVAAGAILLQWILVSIVRLQPESAQPLL